MKSDDEAKAAFLREVKGLPFPTRRIDRNETIEHTMRKCTRCGNYTAFFISAGVPNCHTCGGKLC